MANTTTTPIFLRDLSADLQRETLRDEPALQQAVAEGKDIVVGYFLLKPQVEQ